MESLLEQITQQIQLIKELEASYPKYINGVGRYNPINTPFEIHHVKVRDAYWQKRILEAKLEDISLEETAKIY